MAEKTVDDGDPLELEPERIEIGFELALAGWVDHCPLGDRPRPDPASGPQAVADARHGLEVALAEVSDSLWDGWPWERIAEPPNDTAAHLAYFALALDERVPPLCQANWPAGDARWRVLGWVFSLPGAGRGDLNRLYIPVAWDGMSLVNEPPHVIRSLPDPTGELRCSREQAGRFFERWIRAWTRAANPSAARAHLRDERGQPGFGLARRNSDGTGSESVWREQGPDLVRTHGRSLNLGFEQSRSVGSVAPSKAMSGERDVQGAGDRPGRAQPRIDLSGVYGGAKLIARVVGRDASTVRSWSHRSGSKTREVRKAGEGRYYLPDVLARFPDRANSLAVTFKEMVDSGAAGISRGDPLPPRTASQDSCRGAGDCRG